MAALDLHLHTRWRVRPEMSLGFRQDVFRVLVGNEAERQLRSSFAGDDRFGPLPLIT